MKKFFLTVLVCLIGVFMSETSTYAYQCPIKCANFTYTTFERTSSSITIREKFTVENISNREVSLYVDDFILRKQGFNTVKPGHFGGGFSSTVKNPLYTNSSYSLYPGDIIAVSLDYHVRDTTASGWKLCYSDYKGIVVLSYID